MLLGDFLNSVPLTYKIEIYNNELDINPRFSKFVINPAPVLNFKRPEHIDEYIQKYSGYYIQDVHLLKNTIILHINKTDTIGPVTFI